MKITPSLYHARSTVRDTFIALRHPNYRLWFYGQLVSLIGTWMQNTAQSYLVYEITKSPAYLGYVGFAAGLPSWLFILYGGVIADRMSRRRLLVITQTAMMILAFALAALVMLKLVQPWHIILLALLLGTANAFDAPARQAFVVELVDREDMTNAIALNSTMFNAATVVGPTIAGLTYAAVGPGWCFILNGISFLAVIIALLLMRLKPADNMPKRTSAISQIREGLSFSISNPIIRILVLNMGVLSLFGLSMMTLLPAWSVEVLSGDVRTNGLLLSARGAGSLLGALMVASLSRFKFRGKIWTLGSFVMPLMMFAFAATRWLPLSVAILVSIGWSFMIQANTSNALVQAQAPDHLRGRVMSLYTLTFFGGMPLGALLVGTLATYLNEPRTLTINAAILLGFSALVWLRLPFMRRLE